MTFWEIKCNTTLKLGLTPAGGVFKMLCETMKYSFPTVYRKKISVNL